MIIAVIFSNLSKWKKPEKYQGFNGIRTRDLHDFIYNISHPVKCQYFRGYDWKYFTWNNFFLGWNFLRKFHVVLLARFVFLRSVFGLNGAAGYFLKLQSSSYLLTHVFHFLFYVRHHNASISLKKGRKEGLTFCLMNRLPLVVLFFILTVQTIFFYSMWMLW